MNEDVKGYALELVDLRGKPKDVLSRLSRSTWTSGLIGEISYLKSLIDLWESTNQNASDRLILDLSFMQTFDYYTGIVFEVASNYYVVSQGGRYDRLLGLHHLTKNCFGEPNLILLFRIAGLDPTWYQTTGAVFEDDKTTVGLEENSEKRIEDLGENLIDPDGFPKIPHDLEEGC